MLSRNINSGGAIAKGKGGTGRGAISRGYVYGNQAVGNFRIQDNWSLNTDHWTRQQEQMRREREELLRQQKEREEDFLTAEDIQLKLALKDSKELADKERRGMSRYI